MKKRESRFRFMCRGAILITAAVLIGNGAEARSNGIAGYSGEDGFSCNSHHAGGVAPEVHFEGPTNVAAGQTTLFRFIVRSNAPEDQILAGFNVSADGGVLGTAPESRGVRTQEFAGAIEVTHTSPRENDANDQASWLFSWQAPAELGEVTLFGAGNSVDGFGDESGDESATTTLPIHVGCAGDCSDDEVVTVDELVRGIDIALGGEAVDACPLIDANGDGAVSISDLVAAVDSAVNGCP